MPSGQPAESALSEVEGMPALQKITWGRPPSAVRRSEAPHFLAWKTGSSCARLDSRGRLSPRGYRRPSSPLISPLVNPPTRGNGRPLSVTATATMISLARGASLILTSMPSK